jgi:hypothetical protein
MACGVMCPAWAGKFLDRWCTRVMRSKIEPMKKEAKTIRKHKELILIGLPKNHIFELDGV